MTSHLPAPIRGKGMWLTEDKDAALTIATCGSRLCGNIEVDSPTHRVRGVQKCALKLYPAKRTQGICGLLVINDLASSGPDTWEGNVADGGQRRRPYDRHLRQSTLWKHRGRQPNTPG